MPRVATQVRDRSMIAAVAATEAWRQPRTGRRYHYVQTLDIEPADDLIVEQSRLARRAGTSLEARHGTEDNPFDGVVVWGLEYSLDDGATWTKGPRGRLPLGEWQNSSAIRPGDVPTRTGGLYSKSRGQWQQTPAGTLWRGFVRVKNKRIGTTVEFFDEGPLR